MTAPLTKNIGTISEYIYDLLVENQTIVGVDKVHYGDQERPGNLAICVEPGRKDQELAGAQNRVNVELQVFVIVYVAKLNSSTETRKKADNISAEVEKILQNDLRMGGNVIHGYVRSILSGYVPRGGALLRSSRIEWRGISKVGLP